MKVLFKRGNIINYFLFMHLAPNLYFEGIFSRSSLLDTHTTNSSWLQKSKYSSKKARAEDNIHPKKVDSQTLHQGRLKHGPCTKIKEQ
uniref:Uncharacterized protein n=1 Tax=Pseudonaja textilis TaxID=8673 RepID=A0A670ZBS1_PSETE